MKFSGRYFRNVRKGKDSLGCQLDVWRCFLGATSMTRSINSVEHTVVDIQLCDICTRKNNNI